MSVDITLPEIVEPAKVQAKQVLLVANGDLRPAANQTLLAGSQRNGRSLHQAVADAGYELVRAHPFKPEEGHGFIGSQKEGMEVFAGIDPQRPADRGRSRLAIFASPAARPDLASRADPDRRQLVGHLAGPGRHAESERLADQGRREILDAVERGFLRPAFAKSLARWLEKGKLRHPTDHVVALADVSMPQALRKLGEALAEQLLQREGDHGRVRRRLHGHVQRHHARSIC